MAELDRIERLDEAVDALLGKAAGRRDAAADPELAMLLVIVDDLRGLPDPQFKLRLKRDLVPNAQEEEAMSTTVVKGLRPGFHTITPYLVVEGAAELIEFMKVAFGAEEQLRVPGPDGRLMHAEVRIGDSMIELGDRNESIKSRPAAIHLYVDDADALYQRAIAAGATSLRQPTDQPYGDREASIKDRFGNHWYIATHQENVTEEEMMRRFAGQGSAPHKDPAVATRPEGFRTVTPVLHPRGTASLIDFVRNVFGGVAAWEPTVMPDGAIAHAAMRIGDSVLEMGEAHGEFQPMPCGLHVYVDNPDATYERAIRAGATSLYAPADQPYGERSGGVVDPFGNQWFIAAPSKR
jgi:uncharacterized glyoxalase superfamily protein PhnB